MSTLCFACATATRSNGVVCCGFVLYDFVNTFFPFANGLKPKSKFDIKVFFSCFSFFCFGVYFRSPILHRIFIDIQKHSFHFLFLTMTHTKAFYFARSPFFAVLSCDRFAVAGISEERRRDILCALPSKGRIPFILREARATHLLVRSGKILVCLSSSILRERIHSAFIAINCRTLIA